LRLLVNTHPTEPVYFLSLVRLEVPHLELRVALTQPELVVELTQPLAVLFDKLDHDSLLLTLLY